MEAITAQEEVILMGSKEQTLIAKGKRTKRLRPQSPIPFPITTTTTTNSSTGDGGDRTSDPGDVNNLTITTTITTANLSPTSSSAELLQQDSTEEEEDMANCLILLAQGQSRPGTTTSFSPKQNPLAGAEQEDMVVVAGGGSNYKYNSRRFLETAGKGSASGCYVYECKTCNRTFPSFQALGGHRASHKKPKAANMADHQEKKLFGLVSDDDETLLFKNNNNNNNISSAALSLQLSHRSLYGSHNNNNKNKIHECSICGAEFTSGQALGGHMRRHRAPVGTTNTTLSLTPMALEQHVDHHHHLQPKKPRTVLSLDLDLNLPAPEDDHRESKFAFVSQQQQQKQPQSSLVFSAPALVDCHY